MSLAVVLLCFSLFLLLQSRFVSSLLPNIMLKSLTEPGSLILFYVSLYLDSLFYSRLPFLPSLYLEFPNIQRSSSYSAPLSTYSSPLASCTPNPTRTVSFGPALSCSLSPLLLGCCISHLCISSQTPLFSSVLSHATPYSKFSSYHPLKFPGVPLRSGHLNGELQQNDRKRQCGLARLSPLPKPSQRYLKHTPSSQNYPSSRRTRAHLFFRSIEHCKREWYFPA